jgi:hypothetical protein
MKKSLSVLMVVLAGCTTPLGGSGAEMRVRTENEAYTIQGTASAAPVRFYVANTGNEAIYVPRCGDQLAVVVDRREVGEWRQAFVSNQLCTAVNVTAPLAVAPGDSVRSMVNVGDAGRYRIRITATTNPRSERFDVGLSNEFTVAYSPMD